MGRHIVVIAFVVALIGSVVVFFQRNEKQSHKLAAKDAVNESHPRIAIEEFVLYEYEDHRATATFQGKLAQFQDPDTLEIFGAVRGNRLSGEHKEFVAAESATLRFASKGLTELVKDSKLQTLVLENQVHFGSDDVSLFTDYAKYDHETGKLVSDRPVRMQNPQADMLGKKGFEYDSKTKDVKVFGPMEGTLVDGHKKP